MSALLTFTAYRGLADRVRTLDIGAHRRVAAGMGRGRFGVPLRLECISHTYLRLLGVRPLLGRTFESHEDVEDGAPLLLLGHRFWTRHFGADPAVVGETVEVNARRYTIIGVGPRGFGGVERPGADAWTLLSASPVQCVGHDNWGWFSLPVIGRIREPYTLAQAAGEMASYRATIEDLNGEMFPMGSGAPVMPLYHPQYRASSPEWRMLRWVGGAGGRANAREHGSGG